MRLFPLALCLISSAAFAAPTLDLTASEPVLSDLTVGEGTASIKLGESQKVLEQALGQKASVAGKAFTLEWGAARFSGLGRVSHITYSVKAQGELSVRMEGEAVAIDPAMPLADLPIAGCAVPQGNLRACNKGVWLEKSGDTLKVHVATSSLNDLAGSWRVTDVLVLGDGRKRPDLGKGGAGKISDSQIRLGDSRCQPKEETLTIRTREEWLSKLGVTTDAFDDVPLVFDVGTGCTDVLAHVYAVGDKMVGHRAHVLYVFERQ